MSSSIQQLQTNFARAARFLEQATNLGQSQDPKDVYYLIDFLVRVVNEAYPYIPCQSGCSMCCVNSGLPRTSSLEWVHIHSYLRDEMPPETLTQVLQQNESWHRQQLDLFLQEQKRIESPDSELPLPTFGCKQCPLLVNDMCTVYPVRPAICRGFGYFTWRRGPSQESQIFACQMAADTLHQGLALRGEAQAALPVWNKVSDTVYALNQAHGSGVLATLPLWLLAHTDAQGQLSELNLQPDFEALATEPSNS